MNKIKPIPESIASEWHPILNGTLVVDDLSHASNKKVWWLDRFGHEWEATPNNRVNNNRNCPYCANQKVLPGFNDLETTYPELANQFLPTLNGSLTPNRIFANSRSITVTWVCDQGHQQQSTPAVRLARFKSGKTCTICTGHVILPGFNDLKTKYPELAEQWHPTKNLPLAPDTYNPKNINPVHWICENNHEWVTSTSKRILSKTGCTECHNRHLRPVENNLLETNPKVAAEWHPSLNLPVKPENLTAGSGFLSWWVDELGHEWQATVNTRTQGHNCPICAGKRTLTGYNDAVTNALPHMEQWHPTLNKGLIPASIRPSTHQKVWWQCEKGHEWEATMKDRTRGTNCPKCAKTVSEPENIIYRYLINHSIEVEQSNKTILPGRQELDLYLPEQKIAIEYNGLHWHSEAKGKPKKYHYDKWLVCKELGIQLIQIWEDDWTRNPELILKSLLNKSGNQESLKIAARKTKIVLIPRGKAKIFLNENHIQGYAAGSYYLGLQDQNQKLVAVMVLTKKPENILEIARYATNQNVQGGFSKLLKYAEREYVPNKFITFSDHTISDGGLYENNGFIADREVVPDYMYIVGKQRKHKFGYRLARFKNDPNLLWEEGLTERQLAELNSLPRIWDAGKTRWVKQY